MASEFLACFCKANSANNRWKPVQGYLKRVSTFMNVAKLELPS
jgi:hypothetical protein